MDSQILFSFCLAVLALAISPGPDNIFVLTQSVAYGKKYGFATVAGLMSGCLIHTSVVAFGVSTIILSVPFLFTAIKVCGALYLFFLAYKVYQSDAAIYLNQISAEKKSVWELYKIGFTMNVLNPKVTLFFLSFFPGFLFSKSLSTVVQFYILGGLFICSSFIVFGSIAYFGGEIAKQIQQYKSIGVFLKWLQIVVFVGIAVFLLVA